MKKLIASIAMGAMLLGIGMTSVGAEEYKVVKGDNLWNIAMDNDTTVDYLVKINNLETTIIQPEQTLIVNHIYTVEMDDTLAGIAEEFNTTVEDLREWNDLKYNFLLYGQELIVYDIDLDSIDNEVVNTSSLVNKTERNANTNKSRNSEEKVESKSEAKTITVEATAYTAECDGCSGITYTGINLNKDRHAKVIAVDPNVIPLGTEVYVEGYGRAIAGDIGGAIKGNRIDIHVPTKKEAFSWGRRTVNVTILE